MPADRFNHKERRLRLTHAVTGRSVESCCGDSTLGWVYPEGGHFPELSAHRNHNWASGFRSAIASNATPAHEGRAPRCGRPMPDYPAGILMHPTFGRHPLAPPGPAVPPGPTGDSEPLAPPGPAEPPGPLGITPEAPPPSAVPTGPLGMATSAPPPGPAVTLPMAPQGVPSAFTHGGGGAG